MKIWEARTKKGIYLVELERLTGISKSALNNYENGKCYPDMEQMEKIAEVLQKQYSDTIWIYVYMKHPYKIWLGKDGSWHMYLPDEDNERIPKKRKNEED